MTTSIFECGQTVIIESHAWHEAFSVAHAAFSGLSGSSGATSGSGVAPEGLRDPFVLRRRVLPANGPTSGTNEEAQEEEEEQARGVVSEIRREHPGKRDLVRADDAACVEQAAEGSAIKAQKREESGDAEEEEDDGTRQRQY